jgi:RNA polymerase sigma factor (sigma-70 family)
MRAAVVWPRPSGYTGAAMADHELLERWREGDQAAGRELFARHFDSVFWFFRNKIDVGADDLAQDTFLALVRNRETVGRKASFRAYLFAVARSKLVDALRARAPARDFDTSHSSVVDAGQSPASAIDGRREHMQLLAALRRLPVDLQTMLELRFFEQLSGPELAEVLEIPEGTVRSRLRRAFELLREHMRAGTETEEFSDADFESWATQVRRGQPADAR